MQGKVSIIIPVYNRQDVVRECVQSILAQSYKNFEIILIDDGSSDRTVEVCRQMAAEDTRIRVLEQQHGGVSAARNLGLESATGKFVFFIDSDDVIHPKLIETLVVAIATTKAAMAASDVVNVSVQNWHLVRERLEHPSDPGVTMHQTNDQAVNAMFTGKSPLGCIGGVMIRRDLIGATRFRSDLFIGEDFFFIYENLIKGTSVEFLKQNWYYVRLHENNSSWNYGYDGFYTRFQRRKLVWESEEALGRPEYARLQKGAALHVFLLCAEKKGVSKEDRRKMCRVMKQHRKVLIPGLSIFGKVQFYLAVYAPVLYNRSVFTGMVSWKKKLSGLTAKNRQKSRPVKQQMELKKDIETDKVTNSKNYELLNQFLSMSVSTGEQVFSAFEQLPGAVSGKGENDLERYVYVPGTRQDRVLLVAHADTVWDTAYGNSPSGTSLAFKDGVFYSTDPERGIGADDRAGCAMLYALRDSGHSLLILGGEEHGKKGAWYLRKSNKDLFKELNRHRFMIEFDWIGAGKCLFNQVDYSARFKKYIEEQLGVCDSQKSGGCDLQILCHKVCGANVSVGYHHVHSSKETLVLDEWEDTYNRMLFFLQKEHPRFPADKRKRLITHVKRTRSYILSAKNKIRKLLKLKSRTSNPTMKSS